MFIKKEISMKNMFSPGYTHQPFLQFPIHHIISTVIFIITDA